MNILVEGRMLLSDPILESIKSWGHGIEILEFGTDDLKKLEQERFELLILDIFPPKVKCNEFIPACREYWPSIGIIAMTDNPSREQELEVRRQNVINYMIKPFSTVILKQILDHVAKKKKA